MKKVLWSIAAATLILTLAGCSNVATPAQSEDSPLRPVLETVPEDTGPVESETVVLSAGNVPVEEPPLETNPEPEAPAESSAAAPQNAPVPKRTAEKTEQIPDPAPILSPQPDPDPAPIPTPPVESEPSEEPAPPAASGPSEPEFSIDRWISYAQEYAKTVGLNLDSTAVDCWDNPITAGAHCIYLERDIQSRLNRYARDETILDVWVWAEDRSDGSYDLYIGYA